MDSGETELVVGGLGILVNDSDVDGDSLSAILVGDVAHGTLALDPSGSFSYTPDTDYLGSDGFTYRAGAVGCSGLERSGNAAADA